MEGGQRVGRFSRFVYRNNCSRFPTGGKGVRSPRPIEDGEKMLLLKEGDVKGVDKQFGQGSKQWMSKAWIPQL